MKKPHHQVARELRWKEATADAPFISFYFSGCPDMNIYRVLGDRIGTSETRELAQQLASWHDAMVKHLRVVGSRPTLQCGEGCPHEEAGVLWAAAQETFGASAGQLDFLRSHGQRRRASRPSGALDRAVEMNA